MKTVKNIYSCQDILHFKCQTIKWNKTSQKLLKLFYTEPVFEDRQTQHEVSLKFYKKIYTQLNICIDCAFYTRDVRWEGFDESVFIRD